jgi:FixJ family two-component response regulator
VFESAERFLKAPPRKVCLILHLRMDRMSGHELHWSIATLGVDHQVIFRSADADTRVICED